MSERASFTSAYMYNLDDYKKLRSALNFKSKYFCLAPPVDWGAGELPIIQGKLGSLCMGYEYLELVDALFGISVEDEAHFIVISDYMNNAVRVVLRPSGDVDVYDLVDELRANYDY